MWDVPGGDQNTSRCEPRATIGLPPLSTRARARSPSGPIALSSRLSLSAPTRRPRPREENHDPVATVGCRLTLPLGNTRRETVRLVSCRCALALDPPSRRRPLSETGEPRPARPRAPPSTGPPATPQCSALRPPTTTPSSPSALGMAPRPT
ncbi:hypothetical protein VTK73DRAFT_3338 [Phialemonium thermophilum]|uniref:Uncharacterized protein n=1 Tax=Phialemonium thermophilum TaxID=223376 RepID=A0ABR3VJM1_9PEZI